MGFQGANVINSGPNRWERLSSVLGDTLDRYQQNKRYSDQQQTQNAQLDQKKQEITQKIVQWYASASPEERKRFNALNGGSGPPGFDSPDFAPTDAEVSQGNYTKFLRGASENMDAPLTADPSKVALFNDKAAGSKPFFDYQGQRFNYQNPTALPPQVTTAQETSDKLIPTGQEAWTNTNVTQPKAKADIAKTGAETTKTGAETVKVKAETGKIGAETRKIGAETKQIAGANQGLADSVVQDPQSYFSLPPEQKKQVVNTLGRAPNKISAEELNRAGSAKYALATITDIRDTLKKWQDRGVDITGPLRGRYEAAANTWGDIPTLPNVPAQFHDEAQQDIASLKEWMVALPIQEAKALAGGRAAVQVIQMLVNSNPSLAKSKQTQEGALAGLEKRFNQALEIIDKRQWGKSGAPRSAGAVATDVNSGGLYGTYVQGQGLVKH